MTEDTTPDTDQPIQQLDSATIQQIAAGEVVERPASVVKELIENSLDAGATRISVAVEDGGKTAIRVSDNGHGISDSELPLAVTEHATSKIRSIDDLAAVDSLGFRGEALSTIGAVSTLTIRSRPPEATAGAEITVQGGDIGEVTPAGCPEGTTVEVTELFFNTPARKKFLKQETTEFDHINTVVSQYALANPAVAVALEHNGRELFATDGAGSLRSAVLSVYGREVAESMIDVEYNGEDDDPVDSIAGLVSHPETTRSTREYLATFLNDRYVTATTLRTAVVDGYGGQLAADRYPFAVLFVEMPSDSVDVNVHPRKTEVRFDEAAAVKQTVRETVEGALIDNGLIRASAPRGRSAPTETTIEPESTADSVVGGAGTPHEQASETDTTQETATEDAQQSAVDDAQQSTVDAAQQATADDAQQPTTDAATPVDPAAEDSWTVDGLDADHATSEPTEPTPPSSSPNSDSSVPNSTASSPASPTSTASSPASPATDSGATPDESTTAQPEPTPQSPTGEASSPTPDSEASQPDLRESVRPQSPTTQQTLTGEETTAGRRYERLPTLQILGQLYDTYLLAAADSGLLLIDQHAADERVNYERLKNAVADSPATQELATPVTLELTAREAALFDDHTDALREIGFHASREDESREIAVTAVPAVFDATVDPTVLRDALLSFVDNAAETAVDALIDELLADLACYPSVTGNTSLTDGSVVELLAALDDCENPYACPHGRPVIIEISREELNDRFERDYPGHSGRREE